MRIIITATLLMLVGCSSGAARELLEAISRDDRTQLPSLLAADAKLATSEQTISGREAVSSALSALPAGGRTDGHHDVAQMVISDALLFALGSDTVHALALFEGSGADERPAALDDYIAAWNAQEDGRRLELLTAFATTGRFVDPSADIAGREALAAHIKSFRTSMPGTALELTGKVHRAGDWFSFTWVMKSGSSTTPGLDVVQLDADGRIALVAGFF